MNSSINSAMDNAILSVSDLTVRSLLPLSRIRKINPEASEIRMIASSTMTTVLKISAPLMFLFSYLVSASISCFDWHRARAVRFG